MYLEEIFETLLNYTSRNKEYYSRLFHDADNEDQKRDVLRELFDDLMEEL